MTRSWQTTLVKHTTDCECSLTPTVLFSSELAIIGQSGSDVLTPRKAATMADMVPDMVERVARAIATAREQNGGPPFDAYDYKYALPALFDEARAAISAMGGAAAEIERLRAFARWAVTDGAFEGRGLDGGDVQEKAVQFGILREVAYDPEKHGPNDCDVEPADPWFVFTFPAVDEQVIPGGPCVFCDIGLKPDDDGVHRANGHKIPCANEQLPSREGE